MLYDLYIIVSCNLYCYKWSKYVKTKKKVNNQHKLNLRLFEVVLKKILNL